MERFIVSSVWLKCPFCGKILHERLKVVEDDASLHYYFPNGSGIGGCPRCEQRISLNDAVRYFDSKMDEQYNDNRVSTKRTEHGGRWYVSIFVGCFFGLVSAYFFEGRFLSGILAMLICFAVSYLFLYLVPKWHEKNMLDTDEPFYRKITFVCIVVLIVLCGLFLYLGSSNK